MNQLVLLSYGRKTEYRRAIFAALSFWAEHKTHHEVQTVIYTDQPSFFEPYLVGLPVRYELLTADSLVAMQQPHGYIHRVKAAIMEQLSEAYPHDELLFIDSDTFFIASPATLLHQLSTGTSFLHKREYTLAEAVQEYAAFDQAHFPQKLLKLLASRTFEVGGAEVKFHPDNYSWNSGVMGLPPRMTPLLPDVLQLMDSFYEHTGWFTCEQIAFSLALQTYTDVQPCDQYIFHYWGKRQKALMDEKLQKLLVPSFAQLPLPERLGRVQQLVPRWKRRIELDRLQEGAVYAFNQGQTVAGLKYAAKAWFSAPLHNTLAKDLWLAFWQKSGRGSKQLAK